MEPENVSEQSPTNLPVQSNRSWWYYPVSWIFQLLLFTAVLAIFGAGLAIAALALLDLIGFTQQYNLFVALGVYGLAVAGSVMIGLKLDKKYNFYYFISANLLAAVAAILLLTFASVFSLYGNDRESYGEQSSLRGAQMNLRAAAELHYNQNNFSYEGFCESEYVQEVRAKADLLTAQSKAHNHLLTCKATKESYAVEIPYFEPMQDKYVCVSANNEPIASSTSVITKDGFCTNDNDTQEENLVAQNKLLQIGGAVNFLDPKTENYVVSEAQLVAQGYLDDSNKGKAPYFDYYAEKVVKIDDTHVILAISTNPAGLTNSYLVDEVQKEVVRELKTGRRNISTVSDWYYVEDDAVKTTYQIVVLDDTVLLVDYVNDIEIVLYTETDPDVSLLEICELGGCDGYVEHTSNGNFRVSRFGRDSIDEQTYVREYIDTIEITIPDEFKQPWLRSKKSEASNRNQATRTYVDQNYGFSFQYPAIYGDLKTDFYPANQPSNWSDNKSLYRIRSEHGQKFVAILYGSDYDSGTDTIKQPVCGNNNYESVQDRCIAKINDSGTNYFEITLDMTYGQEKRYEFLVNDDFSLIIFDGQNNATSDLILDSFERI